VQIRPYGGALLQRKLTSFHQSGEEKSAEQSRIKRRKGRQRERKGRNKIKQNKKREKMQIQWRNEKSIEERRTNKRGEE
jgi:hypothetical protein